jgi:hypothetical protein
MFHKYLFIENMVCLEWSDIEKRMRFNKPFKFIKLKLIPFSAYIPSIRPTNKLFTWLDYDRSLDQEMLLDIDGVSGRLGPKSVIVITVDARPLLPKDLFDLDSLNLEQREQLILATYRKWFAQYVSGPITADLVTRQHVAPLFYEVIAERIRQTIARRKGGLRFIQLFNYLYRDGAPMFTIGGMIGTDQDEQSLARAGILEHRFVRTGPSCLEISVPPLTLREKQWIDGHLDHNLTVGKLQFELDPDLLQNYREFYKEYPMYLETLL